MNQLKITSHHIRNQNRVNKSADQRTSLTYKLQINLFRFQLCALTDRTNQRSVQCLLRNTEEHRPAPPNRKLYATPVQCPIIGQRQISSA